LVIKAVSQIVGPRPEELIEPMNRFPGVSRRFEKITDNLYSDYAHTVEKIKGVMSVAQEMAAKTGQKIIIIYEPLTNRRMHYTKDQHRSIFAGASAIYWVPSFLAREDPSQAVLTPEELIKSLDPSLQAITKPMKSDDQLKSTIQNHLQVGDLVVGLSGGGAGSLDEWLRQNFN
jgi:UDP-N-acetylmuramate--alanine ligase